VGFAKVGNDFVFAPTAGNARITAPQGLRIEGAANMELTAGANMQLKASANLVQKASTIQLN
jgi:hypothetical protein